MRIFLGIILLVLSLAGCKKQGIFYWGDYSKTYYDEMKKPCEDTSAAHLKTLETIIEQSRVKNLAVPPGVHAEYGFIMLKAGKTDVAIANFEQEKARYPESRVLMDRLISSATSHGDANKIENEEYTKLTDHPEDQEKAAQKTGTGASESTN